MTKESLSIWEKSEYCLLSTPDSPQLGRNTKDGKLYQNIVWMNDINSNWVNYLYTSKESLCGIMTDALLS